MSRPPKDQEKPLMAEPVENPAVAMPVKSEKELALIKRAELIKQLEEIEAVHGTTPDDPKELRPFLVDLAPHSQGYIDYNGIRYYQGQIYQVDYALFCSLAEIQGNTHKHERTLREPDNQYRRKQNRSIA